MNSEQTNKEKLTDKVYNRKMLVSLLIVLSSLFCISYSAWAMFTDSLEANQTLSPENFCITAQYREMTVSENQTVYGGYVDLSLGTTAMDSGLYEITLTAGGTAKQCSGYAKLSVGDSSYYSHQMIAGGPRMNAEDDGPFGEIVFRLDLNSIDGEKVNVDFGYTWGTCTFQPSIKDDDEITIGHESSVSDGGDNSADPPPTPTPTESPDIP